MNLFRKLKQQCYQPKAAITVNSSKLSVPIIIFVIAEIMLLLVAPLAYLGWIAPKPETKLFQTYPLTNSQINCMAKSSNAQDIVKSGAYGFYNTNDYIIGSNSSESKIYLQLLLIGGIIRQ